MVASLEEQLLEALDTLKKAQKSVSIKKPFYALFKKLEVTSDQLDNYYIASRKVHTLASQLHQLGMLKVKPLFEFKLPNKVHHWSENHSKGMTIRHGYETLVRDLASMHNIEIQEDPIDTNSSWTGEARAKNLAEEN